VSTMSTLIEVTQADGVAELRFNRPEALNALNVAMAEAFAEEIERLLRDESLRVLLITGAGRAFMAGGASAWRNCAASSVEPPPYPVLASIFVSTLYPLPVRRARVLRTAYFRLPATRETVAFRQHWPTSVECTPS
jgi:hypothetical protein